MDMKELDYIVAIADAGSISAPGDVCIWRLDLTRDRR